MATILKRLSKHKTIVNDHPNGSEIIDKLYAHRKYSAMSMQCTIKDLFSIS